MMFNDHSEATKMANQKKTKWTTHTYPLVSFNMAMANPLEMEVSIWKSSRDVPLLCMFDYQRVLPHSVKSKWTSGLSTGFKPGNHQRNAMIAMQNGSLRAVPMSFSDGFLLFGRPFVVRREERKCRPSKKPLTGYLGAEPWRAANSRWSDGGFSAKIIEINGWFSNKPCLIVKEYFKKMERRAYDNMSHRYTVFFKTNLMTERVLIAVNWVALCWCGECNMNLLLEPALAPKMRVACFHDFCPNFVIQNQLWKTFGDLSIRHANFWFFV